MMATVYCKGANDLSKHRNTCHSGNVSFHLPHCVPPREGQVIHLIKRTTYLAPHIVKRYSPFPLRVHQ